MNQTTQLINIFKSILKKENYGWVIFENGTCVIAEKPVTNIQEYAITVLKEAKRHSGTPSSDMTLTKLTNFDGYIMAGDVPNLFVYIPKDAASANAEPIIFVLLGRSFIDQDQKELKIIHTQINVIVKVKE